MMWFGQEIGKEIGVFGLRIACCRPAILWLDFNTDAVPTHSESSHHRDASSAKRINYSCQLLPQKDQDQRWQYADRWNDSFDSVILFFRRAKNIHGPVDDG
jgi:hypothetical protein